MKTFLVITEQKRERGYISCIIVEIKNDRPDNTTLINSRWSKQSNRGTNGEAKRILREDGIIAKDETPFLILVEGEGLTYFNVTDH